MRRVDCLLSAASYSSERFLGDEDAACLIDVDTGVEGVACHLFNELSIGLKDLVVSTLEVNARGLVVPKSALVSTLDAKLHTGELRFAPELLEAEAMKSELADFRRHVTRAGRSVFEARSSAHDDLVLAVSLALWRATGGGKPRGEIRHGTAIGFY